MPEETHLRPRGEFRQVVLATGHMVDSPDRVAPRFPASDVDEVTAAIEATFDRWQVGPGTLVVSGGARGGDIIAAEQALVRGAAVWLLLALPDGEFVATSVAVPGTDWEERFARLRRRCPTRFQSDELGPPEPGEDVFERNNDWCLDVARAQSADAALRVVAVWDGRLGDGPGGTEHLVARARSLGARVEVIPPPSGSR